MSRAVKINARQESEQWTGSHPKADTPNTLPRDGSATRKIRHDDSPSEPWTTYRSSQGDKIYEDVQQMSPPDFDTFSMDFESNQMAPRSEWPMTSDKTYFGLVDSNDALPPVAFRPTKPGSSRKVKPEKSPSLRSIGRSIRLIDKPPRHRKYTGKRNLTELDLQRFNISLIPPDASPTFALDEVVQLVKQNTPQNDRTPIFKQVTLAEIVSLREFVVWAKQEHREPKLETLLQYEQFGICRRDEETGLLEMARTVHGLQAALKYVYEWTSEKESTFQSLDRTSYYLAIKAYWGTGMLGQYGYLHTVPCPCYVWKRNMTQRCSGERCFPPYWLDSKGRLPSATTIRNIDEMLSR
jgi:hypothetical protein